MWQRIEWQTFPLWMNASLSMQRQTMKTTLIRFNVGDMLYLVNVYILKGTKMLIQSLICMVTELFINMFDLLQNLHLTQTD